MMHEEFNECIKVAEKKNEMSFVIKGNGLWQESDKKEEVAGVRRWNRSFQGKREETITFIVSLGSKVGNLTFCCSTSIKYLCFLHQFTICRIDQIAYVINVQKRFLFFTEGSRKVSVSLVCFDYMKLWNNKVYVFCFCIFLFFIFFEKLVLFVFSRFLYICYRLILFETFF